MADVVGMPTVWQVAKHEGFFVFQVVATKHSCLQLAPSAHVLKWTQRITRIGKAGFTTSAFTHHGSWPPEKTMPTGGIRIHVCGQSPCAGDWPVTKYGDPSTAPFLHGRVTRLLPLGAELPDAESLRSELDLFVTHGVGPSVPPPLPPPPGDEPCDAIPEVAAMASEAHGLMGDIAPASVVAVGPSQPDTRSEGMPAADADATSHSPGTPHPHGSGAVATADRPMLGDGIGGEAHSLAGDADFDNDALAGCLHGGADLSSDDDDLHGSGDAFAEVERRFQVRARDLECRADELGRPREWTGLLEFVAFSAMRRRRLLLQLPHGTLDVVKHFAGELVGPDWSLQPFQVQVVCCCGDGTGRNWVSSEMPSTTHFVAAVPAGVAPSCRGKSVAAECLRKGLVVVETVADGDCAMDALCVVQGVQRGLTARTLLRQEIRAFLRQKVRNPVWHDIFANCGEADNQAPPVSPVARQKAEQKSPTPAEAYSASLPRGPPLAPAAASGKHDEPGPNPHGSGVFSEPVEPCPKRSKSDVDKATLAAAGEGRCDPRGSGGPCPPQPDSGLLVPVGDILQDPSLSAVEKEEPKLIAAVRWGSGLPNPAAATVRRLACSLDTEEAHTLVAAHAAHLALPKTLGDSLCRFQGPRTTSLVRRRLADVELFKAFASEKGFDYQGTIPYGMVAAFLEKMSGRPLSRADKKRGGEYLARAIRVAAHTSLWISRRGMVNRIASGDRKIPAWNRRRALGHQGRPCRAPTVRDELYEWFCSIKRSVKGRVTPAYVLRRARLLNEAYIAARLKQGLQADAPVMNHQWLQRWRFEYNISIRKPNRKWKVAGQILAERLCITWGVRSESVRWPSK